jgi:2,4-dienoyl-CoA reductase-like NADH-dependent reductase (Old Yellow Enzyme family)
MYEHLADMFGGVPNSSHFNLYSRWAQHGWGMVVTGNVQVSPTHLSLGRDLVVPANISEEVLEPFRGLARVIHQERTHSKSANTFNCPLAIMQLSHAGRQSPNVLGGRRPFDPPLSPSTIALGSGKRDKDFLSDLFHRLLFQTPQSMSLANIEDVVEAFVRGAKLAALSGFDGVQLHAAHGCGYFFLYN